MPIINLEIRVNGGGTLEKQYIYQPSAAASQVDVPLNVRFRPREYAAGDYIEIRIGTDGLAAIPDGSDASFTFIRVSDTLLQGGTP